MHLHLTSEYQLLFNLSHIRLSVELVQPANIKHSAFDVQLLRLEVTLVDTIQLEL